MLYILLPNLTPHGIFSHKCTIFFANGAKRGKFVMAQETTDSVPQLGILLRRAHELLESRGQPTGEDLLISHLFGANGGVAGNAVWTMLLRQTLASSSLFEQTDEHTWTLASWRSTQLPLDEVEFV